MGGGVEACSKQGACPCIGPSYTCPPPCRGMTTWELQTGSGRIKPDVMAFSKDVMGSRMTSGCR